MALCTTTIANDNKQIQTNQNVIFRCHDKTVKHLHMEYQQIHLLITQLHIDNTHITEQLIMAWPITIECCSYQPHITWPHIWRLVALMPDPLRNIVLFLLKILKCLIFHKHIY